MSPDKVVQIRRNSPLTAHMPHFTDWRSLDMMLSIVNSAVSKNAVCGTLE